MRLRSLLWAVALIALAPLPAKADLITVEFGGSLAPCFPNPLSCDPHIPAVLNGSYVYDSTEPGFALDEYTAYLAVRSFEFSVESQSFSQSFLGDTGLIRLQSGYLAFGSFLIDIYEVTLPAAPGYVLQMELTAEFDPIPDHEPLIPPDFDMYDENSGSFAGAAFFPTRFTVVPEPSTWLMLSVGLSLVGIAARRRRVARF